MLKIQFGEMDRVAYGPTYFKYNYDLEWLKDPFVQGMIEDVDKSRYVAGAVIDSEVLGPIPPERLSGGVQTLIMIYELPGKYIESASYFSWERFFSDLLERETAADPVRHYQKNDLAPYYLGIRNKEKILRTLPGALRAAITGDRV